MRHLLFRLASTARQPAAALAAMSIPSDVQLFLRGYPTAHNDTSLNANLLFYRNVGRCQPDNLLVEEMHEQWADDYDTLEYKHGFIQWLFPIKEHGMNWESQPLQQHEVDSLKSDEAAIARLIGSYKLMLNFYGMRLVDEDTGLLQRSLPPRNYETRYRNLVYSSHNNLRISRILKCLSEFGLERFNAGFLLHVLNEQSEHSELRGRMLISSMDRWWANCIRNDEERAWIRDIIGKVRIEGFIFTREMYEEALARRRETGTLKESEESTTT